MHPPQSSSHHSPLPFYLGPYERWSFSRGLGRPYSFPDIAGGRARYYAALAECDIDPRALAATAPTGLRLPPLWNPANEALAAVPFAFHQGGMSLPDFGDADAGAQIHLTLAGDATGRRFRANFPIAPSSWVRDYDPTIAFDDWTPPTTAPVAIVAVIDDGLPFAHRAFLGSDGRSRVSHVWLQSAAATEGPSAVPFGREFVNSRIDALRARHPDEAQLYRKAGAMSGKLRELGLHLRHRATHGAHIAGLCAGNDARLPGPEIGDNIQIIAVQLPNTVAWDTSGFGKEMFMLSALHYILARARALAAHYPGGPEELPLIINFSYGWSANRHDGGAVLERAIQQLLTRRIAIQPATSLNMPMGNNFAKRMHAQLTRDDLRAGRNRLGWWLSPDDMTSSYLEIWFPKGVDPRGARVTIAAPDGAVLDAGGTIELWPEQSDSGDPRHFVDLSIGGRVVAQLSADQHLSERWRVLLALIPTGYTRGQARRAPAGEWLIEVDCPGLRPQDSVDIWLQRDDDPAAMASGGRQSHLVLRQPSPKRAPGHDVDMLHVVRGYGMFNGIASAAATTRVAGYVQTSRRPSAYSGAGGLRHRDGGLGHWGVGPSLAAPADQGMMRAGLPSIGVLSGAGSRLQGTSAAAAVATRWMAHNLSTGRAMTAGMEALPPLPEGHEHCPNCRAIRRARLGQGLVPALRG